MRPRVLWIGLALVALALVAALIALNVMIGAYLRGEDFRRLVAARTGRALRADVSVTPLRWSGPSVYADTLRGDGEPGAPLERIEARQVRAGFDWRGILEGAWRVERIDVVRLDAAIRTESGAAEPAPEPGAAPVPRTRGIWPDRFELRGVAVQDANVAIGKAAAIHGTTLDVAPEGTGWRFDGAGGTLELTGRADSELEIDRFRARLQQDVLYLTAAEFRTGGAGRVTASGEIGSSAPGRLHVEWESLDVSRLLGAPWNQRLAGALAGQADVVILPGQAVEAKGDFRLTDGHIEGVPVQGRIAEFTRSPQFKRMPLHEVSGKFSTDGGGTTVRDFVAESKGLLRMEGACRVGIDGSLAGEFRIGVTPQTLQWLPGSQEKVFTVSRGGYLWTDVEVRGTLDAPIENLSSRLALAMGEKVIETGAGLINEAPAAAKDAIETAIDILSPLLP